MDKFFIPCDVSDFWFYITNQKYHPFVPSGDEKRPKPKNFDPGGH